MLDNNCLDLSDKNLQEDMNLQGLDAIIFHPPYTNKKGEWDSTIKAIDNHPQKLFVMLAINAREREEYFGKRKNLVSITSVGSSVPFFTNPDEFIREYVSELKK